MIKIVKIKANEKLFYFSEGRLEKILKTGTHLIFCPFKKIQLNLSNERNPWIIHEDLDIIIKSGLLGDEATVIDLNDSQRALIWIENRFEKILKSGLYAFWNSVKNVKVEIIDAGLVKFEHKDINTILNSKGSDQFLNEFVVENSFVGLFFKNGEFIEELKPGRYVFWKDMAKIKLFNKDMKSQSLDVVGQDIMTNDKVTLRINALVNYNIIDAFKSVTKVEDTIQVIYKEAQLVLRSVIGTKELDVLLMDKNIVIKELEDGLNIKVKEFGLLITSFGIKDIILPGEMKDILNKVIEAKKVAEANLIARREETAAMRSQANTAKMLEDNPTLMRLRELEVLEKISTKTNLSVMLGNESLTDKIVKLI